MERKFPSMTGLSIAMDTGFLMTNPSVTSTGLLLMPISLLIAFVIPGNRVLPLGDLPNLISIMSLTTIVMGGNVIRAVLAGIPIVATFMLVASKMAPIITEQAAAAGVNLGTGASQITAFTDGGNQIRYWLYWLFQGNIIALAIIPVVLVMMFIAWRNYKAMVKSGL
jgi:PTS system galactitol-specific IIC component